MKKLQTRQNNDSIFARMHTALAESNGYALATPKILKKNSLNVSFFVTNRTETFLKILVSFLIVGKASSVTNVTKNSSKYLFRNTDNKTSIGFTRADLGITKEREEMKHAKHNILKAAIIAVISISAVYAQGTPRLDIQMMDQKVNLSVAEKQDASIITYVPGDTLKYIITASNVGDGLMSDPEIVDPIPAGVTYIAGSATGESTLISFSIDQGNTYMDWPPMYTVRNANGILMKRKATPEMISHIKWNILRNLNPGDKSSLEFLVVVNK